MKLSENCQGLNHLGLPTENLEKTIAFYESLGFTVAWRTQPGAEGCKGAGMQLNDLGLEADECEQ